MPVVFARVEPRPHRLRGTGWGLVERDDRLPGWLQACEPRQPIQAPDLGRAIANSLADVQPQGASFDQRDVQFLENKFEAILLRYLGRALRRQGGR